MAERLQKIISQAGVASRRAAEKLIEAGRVAVDGRVVKELGLKLEMAEHVITVDGKPLAQREHHVYFLLNKPKGYLSTAKDERGRRTVLDLLPEVRERVYPVGRLDNNTEGLLLITNDGALMNGLLHPKYEVEKTYVARVTGELTLERLKALREGLLLEDGMTHRPGWSFWARSVVSHVSPSPSMRDATARCAACSRLSAATCVRSSAPVLLGLR